MAYVSRNIPRPFSLPCILFLLLSGMAFGDWQHPSRAFTKGFWSQEEVGPISWGNGVLACLRFHISSWESRERKALVSQRDDVPGWPFLSSPEGSLSTCRRLFCRLTTQPADFLGPTSGEAGLSLSIVSLLVEAHDKRTPGRHRQN